MGRLQPSSQLKEEQIIAFLGELGRGILISMKNGVPRAEPHFFPVLVFKKKKKKKYRLLLWASIILGPGDTAVYKTKSLSA